MKYYALLSVLVLLLLTGCKKEGDTVVYQVSHQPVANNDTASTFVGNPIDIDVLANDSDPSGAPLTVTSVTGASCGTVSINPDGTVRYRPLRDLPGVQRGGQFIDSRPARLRGL